MGKRFTLDCAVKTYPAVSLNGVFMKRYSFVLGLIVLMGLHSTASAAQRLDATSGARPQGRNDRARTLCAEHCAGDAEPEARAGAGSAGLRLRGFAGGVRLDREPERDRPMFTSRPGWSLRWTGPHPSGKPPVQTQIGYRQVLQRVDSRGAHHLHALPTARSCWR